MKVFSAKFGGVAFFGVAKASKPPKFSPQKSYFLLIRASFLPRKFPSIQYHASSAVLSYHTPGTCIVLYGGCIFTSVALSGELDCTYYVQSPAPLFLEQHLHAPSSLGSCIVRYGDCVRQLLVLLCLEN